MKITDEMVEVAAKLVFDGWVKAQDVDTKWEDLPYISPDDYQGCLDAGRSLLKHFAPLIARAEADEIAVMADQAYEAAEAIGLEHPEESVNRSRMFARAREIEQFARAIRARHATTPLASKEEKSQ